MGNAEPPEEEMELQTRSISSFLRAAQMTMAPLRARALESPSPIPDDAPVTIKTFSFKINQLLAGETARS